MRAPLSWLAEYAELPADLNGRGLAEVLIRARDDTSRYNAHMARDYLIHRPFPREIADFLIETAPLGERSRVLDLAGGPGSLALALARVSRNVSLMELSRGFLAAAKREAKRVNLQLETIHDSCNRFVHRDGLYDAITVSQALHWLDDVQICRGVVRNLAPDGSFFVIHAAMTLPDKHPLGYVLGDRSVLGHKAATPFPDQVSALNRRLTLLFEALDAPDVERIDQEQYRGRNPGRIVPAGITVFRQTRPIGLGFARAFLSPAHIAAVASSPRQFWRDLGILYIKENGQWEETNHASR